MTMVRIALLRGVNVGGRNLVPMKRFRALLTGLGHRDVRTHLQSGNAIFRSDERNAERIAAGIGGAVETEFGVRPHVLVLDLAAQEAAIEGNPYAGRADDPRQVHLFFLADAPADGDLDKLEALRAGSEAFTLAGRVLYLFAPDGIGRSKLAQRAEPRLGVPATARSLKSVLAIAEIARTTATA